MSVKIALAGNPNSGKTTIFNALTGSSQHVGNWPGVTVEKKDGRLKGKPDVVIQDLPGIYSLSPYTLEEVVTRNYLVAEKPDTIINIVDASNLERNLYLTMQLLELGIPVVIALNMMDIVRKRGDKINVSKLQDQLRCPVVETSAVGGDGLQQLINQACELAQLGKASQPQIVFSQRLEKTLAQVGDLLETAGVLKRPELKRWLAVKLFERDEKLLAELHLSDTVRQRLEKMTAECEAELDDDSESIITNERYEYISRLLQQAAKKTLPTGQLSLSDKIDKVVTNRLLALPIFAAVMFVIYYVSITTVGGLLTDWANDGVFGDGWHLFGIGSGAYEAAAEIDPDADPAEFGVWVPGIPVVLENLLAAVNCADWLQSLVLDGIVAGVGAVLGFLPQMMVLFIFLAILEDCGYMARVAFIMDRIFRRFGLSGKSFIPMLVATGCGVPGVMATRTIEKEADRKIAIVTTTFMPCGAKLPIIALIAGALFAESGWVAPICYFIGIAAIIVSGIILKKMRFFAGEPAPFVLELPSYHLPQVKSVLLTMWDRSQSFVKKAGTIILLSTIVIWALGSYNFSMQPTETQDSMLADIGRTVAPVFAPLGWGDQWEAAVGTVTGLIAKENVVSTFGSLYVGLDEVSEDGNEFWAVVAAKYTPLAAFSFMLFNLLCAPCFAAIGAIRREMGSLRWTAFAVGYQCALAYASAMVFYQIGILLNGGTFGLLSAFSLALLAVFLWLLLRPEPKASQNKIQTVFES